MLKHPMRFPCIVAVSAEASGVEGGTWVLGAESSSDFTAALVVGSRGRLQNEAESLVNLWFLSNCVVINC